MSGGFYFCPHCQAPADVAEPGEPHPLCIRCSHRGLVWVEVRNSAATTRTPRQIQVPVEAAPAVHYRRLPAEKRDLRVLAQTGYWHCQACHQVTERDASECCTLCGSGSVVYCPPVFTTEAAA